MANTPVIVLFSALCTWAHVSPGQIMTWYGPARWQDVDITHFNKHGQLLPTVA